MRASVAAINLSLTRPPIHIASARFTIMEPMEFEDFLTEHGAAYLKEVEEEKHYDEPDSENPPTIEPYAILGIEQAATENEIKLAYRRAALKNHPGMILSPGCSLITAHATAIIER